MTMRRRVCSKRVNENRYAMLLWFGHQPLMRTVAEIPGTNGALQRLHTRRFTDGSLCNARW